MDITILLGSKSDLPVAEKCTAVLKKLGIQYQLRVASAPHAEIRGIHHRTSH